MSQKDNKRRRSRDEGKWDRKETEDNTEKEIIGL